MNRGSERAPSQRPTHLLPEPTLVQDFLESSARRLPHKPALIWGRQSWTYAQLDSQANRLAQILIRRGVRRGDRVGLLLGNSLELVVGIFAALKAGALFVAVSPTTKARKLCQLLRDFEPSAVLFGNAAAGGEGLDLALRETASVRVLVACGSEDGAGELAGRPVLVLRRVLEEAPDERPPRQIIDLDLACLIYTSGSTGEPKGVMCGHSNMVFAVGSITQYLKNGESDVILNVLPMAFSYGLYQLLATFQSGGTLVLEDSFTYPAVVLQRMVQERVTGFAGTPTIYAMLLQMGTDGYDLSSLRYLTNAAAGLPAEHLKRIHERLPWVEFYSMHGLTEVVRTLYLPPEWVSRKPGSVGIPIPGTEAWLADEAGARVDAGTVGELVIRGRHVMRGYWKNPSATAERFRSGQIPGETICLTGDLFRTDEQGHFYFVARKDDLIKCRGEKVAPREVEAVLHAIPGVVEAAVVGVPDPILGQAVKAVLVTNGLPLDRAEVIRACRAQLEDHMVPKLVEFRSELPKTASGKIQRNQLA